MERRRSLWTCLCVYWCFPMSREPSARRRSTDSGILSVPSSALPLSYSFCLRIIHRVVFVISTCSPEARSSILELHQAQPFLTSPISWVPYSFPLLLSPQTGLVYAVEFAHRPGRDLINVAKTRPNIVPIIEDARHPLKYRMLVGMVDTIFADVAQPDQARIVGINAKYFLKTGGHCVISIKASCIDSTASAEAVFAAEVQKLREEKFKPLEQLTLEPYERDHAMVTGEYRP